MQAITATLSRWQAGRHGDRYGHARLLIPALAVAALGMAAMMVLGSPVVIFAGMVLFGAGFGVIENATFGQCDHVLSSAPDAQQAGGQSSTTTRQSPNAYALRLAAQEGCHGVVEFLPPRGVVDRRDGSGAG